MKKKEKILYCCINVFGITPTFLLPVFRDKIDNCYYAQKSKNNKIIEFEKINIDKYKEFSKIYNVDTYIKYTIGSDTVYSIDYETGFLFGTREIIISFYRNNTNLFNDSFISYMSDFIVENQDVIKNTNFALTKRFMGYNLADTNLYSYYQIINNDYFFNDRFHIVADAVKILLDIEHLDPKKIMSYKFPNAYRNYLSDLYFENDSLSIRLFKELFNKPPIYNLWNDRIINGFTSFEDFCKIIRIDISFPDYMFKDYSFWKETQLSQDVDEKYNDGYAVYYIQIKKIYKDTNIIIAQDFYTKRNYIKLYANKITLHDFIEYSIDLIKDIRKKICFIVDELNFSVTLDDCFFEQIKLHGINVIIPPYNKYQGIKNKPMWW